MADLDSIAIVESVELIGLPLDFGVVQPILLRVQPLVLSSDGVQVLQFLGSKVEVRFETLIQRVVRASALVLDGVQVPSAARYHAAVVFGLVLQGPEGRSEERLRGNEEETKHRNIGGGWDGSPDEKTFVSDPVAVINGGLYTDRHCGEVGASVLVAIVLGPTLLDTTSSISRGTAVDDRPIAVLLQNEDVAAPPVKAVGGEGFEPRDKRRSQGLDGVQHAGTELERGSGDKFDQYFGQNIKSFQYSTRVPRYSPERTPDQLHIQKTTLQLLAALR